MNLYILVEGKTERKLYPAWLSHLIPELTQKISPTNITYDNYYLISGLGYPRLLDVTLENCLLDIAEINKFDYFLIFLDVDDETPKYREKEVLDRIEQFNIPVQPCKIKVIPQNKCIETWGLANRTIFSRYTTDQMLRQYINFYNVCSRDPEKMLKPHNYTPSTAQYHGKYLNHLFRVKNIRYSKKNPGDFAEAYYLNQLIKRVQNSPTHLNSFQNFLSLCKILKNAISINLRLPT